MNKMYFLGCMGILAASAMLSSCSSDNDDPTPSPNPGSEVVYKWTTDGGLKNRRQGERQRNRNRKRRPGVRLHRQADFKERYLSAQGMGIYCRWC